MISIMLLFVFLLSLCAPIQAQESLKVAAGFITPPLDFTRSRKQVGVEVDWIKEVSKKLDREVEFLYAPVHELEHLLQTQKCDLIMGALSIEESEGLIWTQPFMESPISILVDTSLRPRLLNISDLKTATVGVLEDSFEAKIIQNMYREGQIAKVISYPAERTLDVLADLTTGQIDAFARLSMIATYLKHAAAHLELVFSLPLAKQAICFGVAAQHTELLKQVNQAQQTLAEEGIYQKIMSKWFVTTNFNIELANRTPDSVDR